MYSPCVLEREEHLFSALHDATAHVLGQDVGVGAAERKLRPQVQPFVISTFFATARQHCVVACVAAKPCSHVFKNIG